jgi:hypothetical protein
MIKAEKLSDEAVEAAARAIIIANGGDPDAFLRLTIHKTTIKAWQQVVPLARAALTAGLAAWPGAFPTTTQINRGATEVLILPVRELLSEEIIRLERDKWV